MQRRNTKLPNGQKTDTKSNVLALLLNAALLSELTVNILSDAPSTSPGCFKKRSKSICNETLNITMKKKKEDWIMKHNSRVLNQVLILEGNS